MRKLGADRPLCSRRHIELDDFVTAGGHNAKKNGSK